MKASWLREHFTYCDGHLFLIKKYKYGKRTVGSSASAIHGHRYETISVLKKRFYTHRLVWLYHHGFMPEYIDHINGNCLDNRIENLRVCTHSQNHASKKGGPRSKTGYRGVHRRVNRTTEDTYWAVIMVNREPIRLGTYQTAEDAARAYNMAAKEFFGEFACQNDV